MKNITVVKIGGNVIDDADALKSFVKDFAKLEGPKIIIHGGGKEATKMSAKLEIPTTMIEGRRVTDAATLNVVTMVYAGLINKRIIALLQAEGCNAIGLTGADANVVTATRRNPVPIDYGYVGDIDPAKIDDSFIANLLGSGIVPVFCAIMHDGKGNLLNCNADSVASSIAIAASRIAPADLCFCFEKAGVLADIDDPTSLIRSITADIYAGLKKSGVVNKGMIPKIDNAFKAISSGVRSVTIKYSGDLLVDTGTVIS